MSSIYINGVGCISPQQSYHPHDTLSEITLHHTTRLSCVEPDYTSYLEPKSLRRMGRLLKYGTAAALIALKDAGIASPDMITTGTGLGLLEDSGKFLYNIIDGNEGVLSPTAFIQSTHNTVSGNIALLTSCHGHNNTFAHRALSYESALIDAMLMLAEQPAIQSILAGSYDELTDYSYHILQRLGLTRAEPLTNTALYDGKHDGTILGEGAAYFILQPKPTASTYCRLLDIATVYMHESIETISQRLMQMLARQNMQVADIDLLLSGINGSQSHDEDSHALYNMTVPDIPMATYKHLCGEYMTATSFAMWLAAKILRTGIVPSGIMQQGTCTQPKTILIHNHYKRSHSFILLGV
jgi:3-oxoacyl-[acyl-carrier-protein] synthase II